MSTEIISAPKQPGKRTWLVAMVAHAKAAKLVKQETLRQGELRAGRIADELSFIEQKEQVEILRVTPPVGSSVRLLETSPYLRDQHGAVAGSIGTVMKHSLLHDADTGVLVKWAIGPMVRCDLDELSLV